MHSSLGALGDSFYEYLIKGYIQSNDLLSWTMYLEAIKAIEKKWDTKIKPYC